MKREKAKGHKKQHFVPECYLKAWCDPTTPAGQTPYVWRFDKDGSNPRRKAPERLFVETDLYTIHRADGERDLTLEHGLAGLESAFVGIRATLARRQLLKPKDHVHLCAFIAATHARTPAQRDHMQKQWTKILEKMEHMKAWAETATPEQKRAVWPTPAPSNRPSLAYEDVKRLVETPMQSMLRPMIQTETPLLTRLDLLVLMSDDPQTSFITSDYPCLWFDAEAYRRPSLYQAPALMYESIEISLPVSPRQLIVLNRRGIAGHAMAPARVVDEYNRRTHFECSEFFVGNSNETRPIWFDPGEEPEDSWRKRHAKATGDGP
jgi:uncharacterized protein DUF4238